MTQKYTPTIKFIAKAGLISKGIVYAIFGALILMAVYGRSEEPVKLFGIIKYIMTFGWYGRLTVMLLSAGLLCYSAWKFLQMLLNTEGYPHNIHGYFIRITWLGPFFFYLLLGGHAAIELYKWYFTGSIFDSSNAADMEDVLSHSWGVWLIASIAIGLFINAVSLFYLSFSGKYTTMLTGQRFYDNSPKLARYTGFSGYFLYGLALLIISVLFGLSIYYQDMSMAQGSQSMFNFFINKPYGAILLTFISLGTICYGIYFFMASFYRWKES